jgi:anaerobic ribonucleoside-triphosphate reductase activating protein
LGAEEVSALIGDLLPLPRAVNCARPLSSLPLPTEDSGSGPWLRVVRIHHGSVVDGPGRRSVVQVAGCLHHCVGCYVPETHDPSGGVEIGVSEILATLLDRSGCPRDGVTVSGGEPFLQPIGLLVLLRALKACNVHVVVYSGYTLEALARRPEPEVQEALEIIDLLIDGPFIAALTEGAGEWRGSRNQRLIPRAVRVIQPRL